MFTFDYFVCVHNGERSKAVGWVFFYFFDTARLACLFWLARSSCNVLPALLFGPLLALGCLVLFIGLVVGFVLLAAGCFWLLVALVLLGLLAAGWVCLAWFASGCLLPAFAGSLLAVHC